MRKAAYVGQFMGRHDVALFATLASLDCLDLGTTFVALHYGAAEANPLGVVLLAQHGNIGLIVAKAISLVVFVILVGIVRRTERGLLEAGKPIEAIASHWLLNGALLALFTQLLAVVLSNAIIMLRVIGVW